MIYDMGKKLLSISIAAYNVSETLDECLKHFLTCKNIDDIEVLVIDDGSGDDTCSIAKKYVKKRPDSIKLISKKNGGWGSTVNKGVELATGRFFRQLDGDDYFDSKNLDRFVDYLRDCTSDLVVSPFCHFANDTGAITGFFGNDRNYIPKEEITLDETNLFYPPAMHSMTVKTSILKKENIRITEHCFYTDVEFVLKSLNHAKTISFFDLPIYYYRLGRDGQSMSIAGARKHYGDHQKMLLGMYTYAYKEATSDNMRQIMLRRLIDATMYQYKMYMSLRPSSRHRKELADFDKKLKNVALGCYNENYGAPVRYFRNHNFRFYGVISMLKNMQDKKHEVFLYEK